MHEVYVENCRDLLKVLEVLAQDYTAKEFVTGLSNALGALCSEQEDANGAVEDVYRMIRQYVHIVQESKK